jgi:hypothetical protein
MVDDELEGAARRERDMAAARGQRRGGTRLPRPVLIDENVREISASELTDPSTTSSTRCGNGSATVRFPSLRTPPFACAQPSARSAPESPRNGPAASAASDDQRRLTSRLVACCEPRSRRKRRAIPHLPRRARRTVCVATSPVGGPVWIPGFLCAVTDLPSNRRPTAAPRRSQSTARGSAGAETEPWVKTDGSTPEPLPSALTRSRSQRLINGSAKPGTTPAVEGAGHLRSILARQAWLILHARTVVPVHRLVGGSARVIHPDRSIGRARIRTHMAPMSVHPRDRCVPPAFRACATRPPRNVGRLRTD